jgi:zinc protease
MSYTMRNRRTRWIATPLCLLLLIPAAFAQPAPQPQIEQLLNGLRILLWPKAGSPEVMVKLRIHSGAAFDLAGKAGEMALLGDMLFPDPATIDYFSDQMGGKLNVAVNYDSITVSMVGKAEEFENILDLLHNGVLATQLTPDVVNRVRNTRIKILRDTSISPAAVADRAIAARLFGDFPYGRPSGGSAEELTRLERADLMLARDRFLNSNNATLVVVGGVSRARAMKSLRRLFGPWRKSEQIIPSTFRQPKAPDPRALIVTAPSTDTEIRLALRGLARSDSDYYAATLLAKLALNRWQGLSAELAMKPVFVRSESYLLPGMFVMGATVNGETVADSLTTAKKVLDTLMNVPATSAEIERAKRETLGDIDPNGSRFETVPDAWLDLDTYRLAGVPDSQAALMSISAADLQHVAGRLFKEAAIATVIVGDPVQLKSALKGRIEYEVLGEIVPAAPSSKPPTKPRSNDSPG